jgi:hypothetical protein
MMINRSKTIALVATLVCSLAYSAKATPTTYKTEDGDGKIVVDHTGPGPATPLLLTLFVPQDWGNSQGNEDDKGPKGKGKDEKIDKILKGLKFDLPTKTAFLNEIIGHPIHIRIVPQSVSPIPEPRTWALYGFGALIAAWVIRNQLRSTHAS